MTPDNETSQSDNGLTYRQKWLILGLVLSMVSGAVVIFGATGYFLVKSIAEDIASGIAKEAVKDAKNEAKVAAINAANDRLDARFEAVANELMNRPDFLKFVETSIIQREFGSLSQRIEALEPEGEHYDALNARIAALEPHGVIYNELAGRIAPLSQRIEALEPDGIIYNKLAGRIASLSMSDFYTIKVGYSVEEPSKRKQKFSRQLIHKDEGFCFLSKISGDFGGLKDTVYVNIIDDNWVLGGEYSKSFGLDDPRVTAEAICMIAREIPK